MNRWTQYDYKTTDLQAKIIRTILVTKENVFPFRKFEQCKNVFLYYIDGTKYYENEVWKLPENLEQLLEKRNILKQNKQYKEADEIRNSLNSQGITIRDGKDYFPTMFIEKALNPLEKQASWLYTTKECKDDYSVFLLKYFPEILDWKK